MISLRTALKLVRMGDSDLIWLRYRGDSVRNSTPYTLEEMREKKDWRNTVVHEIRTRFSAAGYVGLEFVISKKGD